MSSLLTVTDRGIYCEKADVFIDPWKPVEKAIITHAHSDHARWGSQKYLAQENNEEILRLRLGKDISLDTLKYDESVAINGVKFSFHPAGHIFGSSQVRVEKGGEVWVGTGDFKLEDDGVATPYVPIQCNTMITESTFGLPVFKWKPQAQVFQEINSWWIKNSSEGKVSVLSAYALGKAQRLLKNLNTEIGEIFVHGAVNNVNEALKKSGLQLPDTTYLKGDVDLKSRRNPMVIATPGALGSSWIRRLGDFEVATVSGWMNIRGIKKRRNAGRGFVMSDHADWEGLNTAVEQANPERVFVTHGYTDVFSRWLRDTGRDAEVMETLFVGESSDFEADA